MAVRVRVLNKTKEGVSVIPLDVGVKIPPQFHSWESFNKSFNPTKDKFIYEMNPQADAEGKALAEWMTKHYASIKMATVGGMNPAGPSGSLTNMAVLGTLADEFCKQFNASPMEFIQTFQTFDKALQMRMNSDFQREMRFKPQSQRSHSDRPNPSAVPKSVSTVMDAPGGATIGDILKAKEGRK